MNDFELREESKKLFRKREPLDEKKRVLFLLAHHHALWALYAKRYLKNPDKELTAWALIAWQESQGNVLNTALKKFGDSNESADATIIGGIGDESGRLRYCFAVSTTGGMFPNERRTLLRRALHNVDKKYGVKIGDTLFGRTYAHVTVLVPHEVAVGDFIEKVINESNGSKPFLRFHYFVVNTRILSREEIKEYVRGLEKK